MGKINSKGYQLDSKQQIISDNRNIFEESFTGLDTSAQTPIGQAILKLSDRIDINQKDNQAVFNSFDLDGCQGNDLDNLGKIIGLTRKAKIPTVINTIFTSTSVGYTLLAGRRFILNSDNTTIFELTANTLIDNLTKEVSLSSVENGNTDVSVGGTLSSITPIPQLTNIVIDSFTQGIDKQSDFDYREALKRVRLGNGVSGIERLNKVLEEVENVSSAVVLDKTNDTTLNKGEILCLVAGGNNIDIANAINNNRDAGVLTTGTITETVQDYLGNDVDISFDRPDTLTATFELEINLIQQITQDQRQAIVDLFEVLCQEVRIGGIFYYQDFYAGVVGIITGTARISSLTINAGTTDIVAGQKEIITPDATIDPNTNITIV